MCFWSDIVGLSVAMRGDGEGLWKYMKLCLKNVFGRDKIYSMFVLMVSRKRNMDLSFSNKCVRTKKNESMKHFRILISI